MPQKPIASTYK